MFVQNKMEDAVHIVTVTIFDKISLIMGPLTWSSHYDSVFIRRQRLYFGEFEQWSVGLPLNRVFISSSYSATARGPVLPRSPVLIWQPKYCIKCMKYYEIKISQGNNNWSMHKLMIRNNKMLQRAARCLIASCILDTCGIF